MLGMFYTEDLEISYVLGISFQYSYLKRKKDFLPNIIIHIEHEAH